MKQANYEYKNYEIALKEQKKRYKERIESIIKNHYYDIYFLTFTFSDKVMSKTSQKTRIRYIKDFLNKQSTEYMLNADYGTKNNREHYHALIVSRYKVIVSDEWNKYGFMKVKKMCPTLNNWNNKLTAEKLLNHAFKATTKDFKIIYSRQAKKRHRTFERKANRKLKDYQKSAIGKANKKIFSALYNSEKESIKQALKEREELNKIFDVYDEID